MIHDTPGGGGDWLAELGGLGRAVCRAPGCGQSAPCGKCIGCTRVANNQHPDLMRVHPMEDSKQLRIEQVRELAQELSLTSHQGGYKVGILSPADSMNRFAANALLKTLEEPPGAHVADPRCDPAFAVAGHDPQPLPEDQGAPITRREPIAWLQETRGRGGLARRAGRARRRARSWPPRPTRRTIPALGAETRRTLGGAGGRRGRSGGHRRALAPPRDRRCACGALRTWLRIGSSGTSGRVQRCEISDGCALATRPFHNEYSGPVRARRERARSQVLRSTCR